MAEMRQFDSVFISHRSYDYDKALRFKHFLINEKISSKVVLFENESLCKNYEQLTVHEYFEAIERIKREMKKCDFFFYFVRENYTNGYFTGAELLQWNAMKDNPKVYPIIEEDGIFKYAEPIALKPLDKYIRKQLSYTSFAMTFDPEYGGAPESWGKYANNCFLVGCCACGEYYLITEKKMKEYIITNDIAICPSCNTPHTKFHQCNSGKKYFSSRYPIVMRPNVRNIVDLKPLGVEDVIDLLNAKELPKRFALVSMPNEKLQSDFKKNMKSLGKKTLGLAATLAAIAGAISLFDKNNEK